MNAIERPEESDNIDVSYQMNEYPRVDAGGATLQTGDVVRTLSVPDLSGMCAEGQLESRPVFEYLVGRRKTITGFNAFGLAELVFTIPPDRLRNRHSVWIEPYLLKKVRRRARTLEAVTAELKQHAEQTDSANTCAPRRTSGTSPA